MTRILIITRAFPFLPGEQFIEPEAPFWERDDAEVVVMPWKAEGDARPVPDGVVVDRCLANITAAQHRAARIAALRSPLLWRELGWLARHRRLDAATAKESLRAVAGALVVRDALAGWIAENGPVDVAYTYWWDVWTYGAQLLKGRGIGRVVSRAHGYDLYQARHPSGYLALKRQLGNQLDCLLPISDDGRREAVQVHGVEEQRVRVSRLGVLVPQTTATTSPAGELHLLSTALMNPVKRIDRLVEALGLLASQHPQLRVSWTHFGDGPLYDQLRARAEEIASGAPNLAVEMPGSVGNDVVRAHMADEPVDLFVNTSESEGVPVSIMEAMAFGVPTLAPAVGGIGEIVPAQGPGGALLSDAPDAEEVAAALWEWHERAKEPEQREAARAVVAERYDRAKNFGGLMDSLIALAAH